MTNNKAIILLSAGLDSAVSLALSKDKYDISLALTFNYGQKSAQKEIFFSKKLSDYYNIKHKIINLDWLSEISASALNLKNNIPQIDMSELDNEEITQKSAKAVWVPNRNGLFINIAAAIAEAKEYSNIIIGANKEEGKTFKDNTSEFINAINVSLKNSTNNNVKVIAPLINYDKAQIVKFGIENDLPFKYIYSCYNDNEKHCGECESCKRLKRALDLNNRNDIIKEIFE